MYAEYIALAASPFVVVLTIVLCPCVDSYKNCVFLVYSACHPCIWLKEKKKSV